MSKTSLVFGLGEGVLDYRRVQVGRLDEGVIMPTGERHISHLMSFRQFKFGPPRYYIDCQYFGTGYNLTHSII